MIQPKEKSTYGYSGQEFKKFQKHAWLVLLSFGFTYLFFYNGRQNINLVIFIKSIDIISLIMYNQGNYIVISKGKQLC